MGLLGRLLALGHRRYGDQAVRSHSPYADGRTNDVSCSALLFVRLWYAYPKRCSRSIIQRCLPAPSTFAHDALHRRHLNESQRAMVAARIATMRQGERTDLVENSTKLSESQAAAMLVVSRESVVAARKVQTQATPEMVAAVDAGAVPVSQAASLADTPPEFQTRVLTKLAARIATMGEGRPEKTSGIPLVSQPQAGAYRARCCPARSSETVSPPKTTADLAAEIDENLIRDDLTVLEQSQYFARRERILIDRGERRGPGGQPGNQNAALERNEGDTVSPLKATTDLAAEIGIGERSLQRRKQIATSIVPGVQEVIADLPIADHTRDLGASSELLGRLVARGERRAVLINPAFNQGGARDALDCGEPIQLRDCFSLHPYLDLPPPCTSRTPLGSSSAYWHLMLGCRHHVRTS